MPTPSRNAIYDATIRRMTACALEEAENRFAVEHAQDTEQQLADYLRKYESRKTGAGEGTNEGAGRKKKKKSSIRYYLIRVTPLRESVIYWETLNQSSAAEQRVFCPHAAD